jgi:predicted nucleic acid-binding protein
VTGRDAKARVYLETSLIGYATTRPSRDLVVAGRQQITREWFALRAGRYELYISQLVVREATSGDAEAARERALFLEPFPRLAITDEAGKLATQLVERGAVPRKSGEDALHIAVAAVHGDTTSSRGTASTSPTRPCVSRSNGCVDRRTSSRRSFARPRS